MRVLYVSDRGEGGIKRHVQCLRSCLPPEVERYTIGEDEPFAGKNGHDVREWLQIRRVVKWFRPDIVHFHTPCFLMALYVRLFSKAKIVCSWHTPTNGNVGLGVKVFFAILGKNCYFLPVSGATWAGLKKWLPYAQGEVFFNPLKRVVSCQELGVSGVTTNPLTTNHFTVGMVGRNADQKDWPSFHRVEELVKAKMPSVKFLNAGENGMCDGRAAIREMDVFVMTSKHEQLPTTMLECFAEGTPICGFVPEGGTQEVLDFSKGPLKSVFVKERDCGKLAKMVAELLQSPERRQALVEDGRQILEGHFDAEENCHGQLMAVYQRLMGETRKMK